MIDCSGNLARSSVAFSGPGGSANVARLAKNTRDVWRDTPSGAMVQSSDSDIVLSSWVSTPIRARHPDPSGFQVLMFLLMGISFVFMDSYTRAESRAVVASAALVLRVAGALGEEV